MQKAALWRKKTLPQQGQNFMRQDNDCKVK